MKLNLNSVLIITGIALLSYGGMRYLGIIKPVNRISSKTKEEKPAEASMGGFSSLGFGMPMILLMFGLFLLMLGTSKNLKLN